MKTTSDSITLTFDDLREHGGDVTRTILAACEASEHLASGTVGPSFATSGPGAGWSKHYDVGDYAARALSDEGGCVGYVDAEDGKLATLDDDGEVVWTENSVVELVAPDADEVDSDPQTVRLMLAALRSGQCLEGEGDWDQVRALVATSQDKALALLAGSIVGDYVVYYDDASRKWYRNDRADLVTLRELMSSDDEEVSGSAYSHWCAYCPHEGEYDSAEEADAAARAH